MKIKVFYMLALCAVSLILMALSIKAFMSTNDFIFLVAIFVSGFVPGMIIGEIVP